MPDTKEKITDTGCQNAFASSVLGRSRRYIRLLGILSALAVGGCAMPPDAVIIVTDHRQTDISTENADADPDTENAADDLLAVLTGEKQFLYFPELHFREGDDKARFMDMADIPAVFSPESRYAEIYDFAIVDLDGDGENEVLLQVIDAAGDMGGYMLLRQENGAIHGYTGNYQTFSELKTDGTFRYSSLAKPDDGIGIVRFQENSYSIIPLACSETLEDQQNVSYQIDQKPVSEEEYLAAVERHKEKTDIVWHRFTEENIQKLFSLATRKDRSLDDTYGQAAINEN